MINYKVYINQAFKESAIGIKNFSSDALGFEYYSKN